MSKLSTTKKNVLHLVGMTLVVGSGIVHLGYALHQRALADVRTPAAVSAAVATTTTPTTPNPSRS